MVTDPIGQIIKQCIAGNEKAMSKFYSIYSPKIWPVCLRYTQNKNEAKDLLQEGFIKIFQKLSQFQFKGLPEAWMRKIVVNLAIENFRKKKLLFVDIDLKTKYISNEDHLSIDESINAEDLMKLIDELSPQYKMVFNLYAIEGYSHKEIANMLNITEGTSKSNLFRAREILKQRVMEIYNNYIGIGS